MPVFADDRVLAQCRELSARSPLWNPRGTAKGGWHRQTWMAPQNVGGTGEGAVVSADSATEVVWFDGFGRSDGRIAPSSVGGRPILPTVVFTPTPFQR